jgi:hypothetical protein
VGGGEPGGVAAGLLVHQVVDVALLVERNRLVAMACHRLEAHGSEQAVQLLRFGVRVLHESEAVGAGGVLRRDLGRRGIVRKRTHLGVSQDRLLRRAVLARYAARANLYLLPGDKKR